MKVTLFDFQEDALLKLQLKLAQAGAFASPDSLQAISFSAPTGSGKTIVMTALFERIFFGEPDFHAQPDAVILWISDMPELNEQTRMKLESKSDRIRVRQLITIDSTFDAEKLSGGNIYFINTQKLGSDKRLTRHGDARQYTLWETLTNTAKAIPDRFYVVIDEAHRGMQQSNQNVKKAQSILQKFLVGSPEDGLISIPIVLGVTATPKRFEDLLTGTERTVHKVVVSPEEVRNSGLLKDRILIHYPESGDQAEMTLLSEATKHWHILTQQWETYCQSQGLEAIRPILVVQVQDGTETILTRTDLPVALTTLETTLGRPLHPEEIAHAFNNQGEIEIGNHRLRYIEPSRIEDDPRINVVFFKMSLSTGWDCPRAEVMMSFRGAQDYTYIAQLLGRMVRTPLARRIEKDAALNDVHLFLPHYDTETVNKVVKGLENVEEVPPATIGTPRELITLQKRSEAEPIFVAMAKQGKELITYRVNAVRKQSALRRLMALSRGLTHDKLAENAQIETVQKIVEQMSAEIQKLRTSGDFPQQVRKITGVNLKTIALQGGQINDTTPAYALQAADADIDRHFDQAGKLLSNGLHIAYWKQYAEQEAAEVKVEVVVLAQNPDTMQALETFANKEFDHLYEQNKRAIADLNEGRVQHYNRLRLATAQPQTIFWNLPDTISFRRTAKAPQFDKHLYVEQDDSFHADLGTWEKGVLEEELKDSSVVAWLRNVDRQNWSLEIPYEYSGEIRPMFPDLLIVRQDTKGYRFDILEPHDSSLNDNAAKAKGLAQFAEKHWQLFDRIQLIRKQKGPDGNEHYFRLDLGVDAIRKQVLMVESDQHLNKIFEKEAKIRQ